VLDQQSGTCTDPRGSKDPAQPLTACSRDGKTTYQLGPSFLDGSKIKSVEPTFSSGQWMVNVTFDAAGTRTWADYTSQNVQKQVAFVLDGQVLSAPTIDVAITGGATEISGNFTQDQVDQMVHQIAGR